MAQQTISILGCGWLGLPLGQRLAQKGYRVKGSTTTPEKLLALAGVGIEPYLITLDPALNGSQVGDFFQADVLFLNIPPGRRRPDADVFFGEQIRAVVKELHYSPIAFVVFASSTSVYENMNGIVVEIDAGKPRPWSLTGRALLDAEDLLRRDTHFDATVLRFAGLYGYSRQPGRFLAGRTHLDNAEAPVNLVHRDDCVAVVEALLEADVRGEVFNVCADEHPTRRALYTQAARRLGLEPPTFNPDGDLSFKIVSNQKLKERLGYRFQYPDPSAAAP